MVATGNLGYVKYVTGFDDNGNPILKDFGLGAVVNSVNLRYEAIRTVGVGCREPLTLSPGRLSANWNVSFVLSDLTTLAILVQDFGILADKPNAIGVEFKGSGIQYLGYDLTNKKLFSYVNRLSISSRVGEVVRVGVDGISKTLAVGTGSGDTNCDVDATPVTFVESSVKVGGSSDIGGYVRGFSVTINGNVEPIYALGSEMFVDVIGRVMAFSGRMTVVLDGIDLYNDLLNSGNTTVEFVLSNNESILFNVARIEEISSRLMPGEVVEADVAIVGTKVGIS